MKEIEIKIQITTDQLKLLKEWLAEHAEFKGEEHHQEYYLDNPDHSFKYMHDNGYLDATDYLRIRINDKGSTITFKRWENSKKSDGDSKNLFEYESGISDPDNLLKIFAVIGYTDNSLMDKTRQKYIAGNFEIVIDDVKDLGIFVEIEVLEHDDDTEVTIKKIYDLLKEIGITKFNKQTRGYISMIWNPDYDFNEPMSL